MNQNLLLHQLDQKIRSLGIREGALFILESHIPISNLLAHLALFFTPFVPLRYGGEYLQLMSDPKNIERLQHLLEERA